MGICVQDAAAGQGPGRDAPPPSGGGHVTTEGPHALVPATGVAPSSRGALRATGTVSLAAWGGAAGWSPLLCGPEGRQERAPHSGQGPGPFPRAGLAAGSLGWRDFSNPKGLNQKGRPEAAGPATGGSSSGGKEPLT